MNHPSDQTGYEQFLGKKVSVTESSRTMKIAGTDMLFEAYQLADDDTTIAEIKSLRDGQVTRIWLPDTIGTMDYHPARLNVYVKKVADGTFEIYQIDWG